jgi:hypothetical protein
MAALVTFSGESKLILINSGVTVVNVKTDIYSSWKEWFTNKGDYSADTGDNSRFLQAMSAVGGDPINETLTLGTTYFLENGWKIRPYEWNHTLTIVGNIYSRDGSASVIPTVGSYNVMVNLQTSNLIDTLSMGTPAQVATAVWTTQTSDGIISGGTVGKMVVDINSTVGDNQALILAGQ